MVYILAVFSGLSLILVEFACYTIACEYYDVTHGKFGIIKVICSYELKC